MREADQPMPGSVPLVGTIDPQDTIFQQIRLADQGATTGATITIPGARSEYDQTLQLSQLLFGIIDTAAHSEYWVEESLQAHPDKPFHSDLLELLRQKALSQRVLVMRLPAEVATSAFLRELAATLSADLQALSATVPQLLRYDPVALGALHEQPSLAALLARQPNTIAIVPQADRRLLGTDLVQFARGLVGSEILVLAATQLAAEVWQLGAGEQEHWIDLTNERIYSQRYLAFGLLRGLIDRHAKLPPSLRVLRPDAPCIGGRTVQEVAILLRSPLRIQAFLSALDQPDAVAEASRMLAQAIRHSTNELIKRWYARLERHQQLLALAMLMVTGMPESAVFSTLQAIYEQVWNLRGPGQPMLDLVDLQPLAELLAFEQHTNREPELNATIGGLRPLLLTHALSLHRRHLQYAQYWLVRQIQATFQSEETPSQTMHSTSQMRWQYMLAISDLAVVAPTLAAPALLSLVAHPHPESRRLVARALGRWQVQGHAEQLIDLVGQWLENPRVILLVNALRGGAAGAAPAMAAAVEVLRLTAFMCYTEAAGSLPAGALSPALVQAILQLVDKTLEPALVQLVSDEVLPVLLHTHISQIAPILDALTQFPALRADLSQNLALVYQTGGERARAVQHVVQGWLAAGLRRGDTRLSTHAEMQLITAAGVLGAIDYQHGGPFARETAWRYLSLILKQLETPTSRATTLAASMRLAGQDPSQLRWVLRESRPAERTVVVADLTEVCRQQRAHRTSIRKSATWADGMTKSPIEQVLIGWLLNEPRQARTDPAEGERLRLLTWETLVAITRRLDLNVAAQPIDDLRDQQYQPIGFYAKQLIPALLQSNLAPDTLALVELFATRVRTLAAEEPQVLEALLDRWLADADLRILAEGIELLLNLDVADYWAIPLVGLPRWLHALWVAIRS